MTNHTVSTWVRKFKSYQGGDFIADLFTPQLTLLFHSRKLNFKTKPRMKYGEGQSD